MRYTYLGIFSPKTIESVRNGNSRSVTEKIKKKRSFYGGRAVKGSLFVFGRNMQEENYSNNKIEVSLSEAMELAMARKEDEKRKLRAAKAKALESVEQIPSGKKLTWKITPEEVARINAGDRAALNAFYFQEDNFRRITYSAYYFMRHNYIYRTVISSEDLIQQVYCDLAVGFLKLRPYDGAISKAIFYSFCFTPVGGLDEIYIPPMEI